MDLRFYVATSRRGHGVGPSAAVVAACLGIELREARPLPLDRPGLVLTAQGPRLYSPGAAPLWWSPGLLDRRLAHGAGGTLRRALGAGPGDTVLDCTFGLGYDALVLAGSGAQVLGFERHAAVLYFALDGINRHRPDLARRVRGAPVEAEVGLRGLARGAFDFVYLDPMFTAGGAGPNLAPLRALAVDEPRPSADFIGEALRVARRAVVLKLGPGESPPLGPGLPPAETIASKRVSFARWAVA